jgi:hypothetical protein
MKLVTLIAFLTVIFVVLTLPALINAADVKGELSYVDDKMVLKVWGNHYERGYAHGYLIGDKAKAEFEQFFIRSLFSNNIPGYEQARDYFLANFSIERKYEDESRGLSYGMYDSGVDIYSSLLGRDLDEIDFMVFTAFTELATCGLFTAKGQFGCSTISNWGASTIDDPDLQGSLVVSRALDGHMDQIVLQNHLMIVHFPSEPDEQKWLNICFPGMISCFSAVNESGVAAFQNVGNHVGDPNSPEFHPVMLSIRNGIEMRDFNGDMASDHYDVATSLMNNGSLTCWIITAASSQEGIIIETSNARGTDYRTSADNTVIPGDNIIATNHFRKLYQPATCNRYSNYTDSLLANIAITIERNWRIICGAAGVPKNTHLIQYIPKLNLINWASAPDKNTPAYTQTPTTFNLQELFYNPQHINEKSQQIDLFDTDCAVVPKSGKIKLNIPTDCQVDLNVYNLQGQLVPRILDSQLSTGIHQVELSSQNLTSGIYYCRLQAGRYTDIVKVVIVE